MSPLPPRLAALLDRASHEPAVRALGAAAAELTGVLLPAHCAVCGVRDGTVCPGCAPELTASLLHPYRAEGEAAALPLLAGEADRDPVPLPVVAAGRYGGALARAVLAFKDHGRTPVGAALRPAVHRALAAAPGLGLLAPGGAPEADAPRGPLDAGPPRSAGRGFPGVRSGPAAGPLLLVPVPASAAGFRRRGYDPVAELLAGPLPPGWRLAPGLLRGAPPTRRPPGPWTGGARADGTAARTGSPAAGASHAGAAAHHRRRRSTGRFRATARSGPARGAGVVLFDDVMTTGATLAAAWRALDAVGLAPCGAVVLAAVTAPGTPADRGLNSG
ncbi:ComF family protein [Citricoccus sp. SGAir0253]|uniref:ComF family protein n=1 Tax=Citricoccus sp. SGAir0253 TaxID=2567881 RepID=UPI0010CD00A8|nr:phosphoribosyltransferase family protein [Citricoccus sp. SGAir0253]QCU77749.1 ComF family protein [Citricoccus sp. SGAir0253]